jgi:methenyltetrahydromethanopterin cyclohydrolase
MSADISVNARAAALVERLVADAAELKIGVTRGASGETLIDCGAGYLGSIAAGLRIAEICMGGLGAITIELSAAVPNWPMTLVGRSSNPVIACLASQYAGWRLSHSAGAEKFFALGSGPARWRGASRCSRNSTTPTERIARPWCWKARARRRPRSSPRSRRIAASKATD